MIIVGGGCLTKFIR